MDFLDQYLQDGSLEIYSAIKARKRVYLDLKYWIMIRDNGMDGSTIASQIAQKVDDLHQTGKCIFPLSEPILMELMKQQDDRSRLATIELAERLSEGVALIGDRQRMKVEFSQWVKSGQDSALKNRSAQLVWANPAMVMGYFFYSKKAEELPEPLRRAFLDFASSISLAETLAGTTSPFVAFIGKDDIDQLNSGKLKYQHENKTFKAMFLSELWGYVSLFAEDFNEVIAAHYFQHIGRYPTSGEKGAQDGEAWCKLIYQAFKAGKIGTELPMLRIFPSLFASMRWNRDRKYKDGNDTADVPHACSALPYCDYFLYRKGTSYNH